MRHRFCRKHLMRKKPRIRRSRKSPRQRSISRPKRPDEHKPRYRGLHLCGAADANMPLRTICRCLHAFNGLANETRTGGNFTDPSDPVDPAAEAGTERRAAEIELTPDDPREIDSAASKITVQGLAIRKSWSR